MSSTYGEHLKLSIFGQSHAPAIGMTLDGVPAGQAIDLDELQRFLDRRAPGRAEYATPRKEADRPEFLSGLVGNVTCGAPLAAIIRNTNTRSGDYSNLAVVPRPGHADYTAAVNGRRRGGRPVRRRAGRGGRRTFFRAADRAALHRGRHLFAAAAARGH